MSTPTYPVRAAIYCRISEDRKEETGVQRQEEECRALCERNGYVVVDTYIDNSISAYKDGVHRPAYARMLEDIKAKRIDTVVVWHTDRLTRRLKVLAEYIDLTTTAGVATDSVTAGNIDLSTASGRMQAQILGAVAEMESAHKSERINAELLQRRRAGKPTKTARRRFGYTQDGDELIPAEAKALRHCYDIFKTTGSLAAGVRWLNSIDLDTPFKKPYKPVMLRRWLLNPANAGLSVHRGEVVGKGEWPAIFTVEEHEHIKTTFEARRKDYVGQDSRPKHLGSNIYRCGCDDCLAAGDKGQRLNTGSKSTRKKSGRRYTYRTYRVKRDFRFPGEHHVSISGDMADSYVEAAVLFRLTRPDVIALVKAKEAETVPAKLRDNAAELSERIAGLEVQFERGTITPEQFGRLNSPLQDRLEKVEADIASYNTAAAENEVLTQAVGNVVEWWSNADIALRRALVKALCDITIMPTKQAGAAVNVGERVRIDWKI